MITDGLHPALLEKVRIVLAVMAREGSPMRIVQGLRTVSQQQILYAQGRTVKGPKVTNCDGIKVRSNHQAQADGWGHAADLAFLGPEPFAEHHPWQLFGDVVRDAGLVWGGDFKSLPDRPHCELPKASAQELKA